MILAAIVGNWIRVNYNDKILICAPSNYAADLIAERLHSIPLLQEKFIRYYSNKQRDIFNMKIENLKPYSMEYKVLHMPNDLQDQFAD